MTTEPALPQSPFQRLVLEQALAFAQHLEAVADGAPHGTILDRCETATLSQGRQFLQSTLTALLQHQAQRAEKKGPTPAPAPVAAAAITRAGRHATC